MRFVICLLNFDVFLSEFREELQKIIKIVDISLFDENCEKKSQKMPEISGIIESDENFIRHFIISIDRVLTADSSFAPKFM